MLRMQLLQQDVTRASTTLCPSRRGIRLCSNTIVETAHTGLKMCGSSLPVMGSIESVPVTIQAMEVLSERRWSCRNSCWGTWPRDQLNHSIDCYEIAMKTRP